MGGVEVGGWVGPKAGLRWWASDKSKSLHIGSLFPGRRQGRERG